MEETSHDLSAWDERHDVSVRWMQAVSDFLPDGGRTERIVVTPADNSLLPLDFLYEPEDSATLIVVLHGALNRSRFKLPRFEWRSTLNRVRASKLYLCDTTVSQRADMELGWYIGQETDNLTKRYADLVQHIAIKAGYVRVMLVGSSGGGFGSLAMSRVIPRSCAVAFSPQTSIAAYHPNHRKILSAVIFPRFTSFDHIEHEFANRINLRTLYRRTEDANYFRYIQNTGDRFHFEAHYAPFALSLGVDPEDGGLTHSGNGAFIPEKYEKGHAPPPRSRFRNHIREAHRAYFGEDLKID